MSERISRSRPVAAPQSEATQSARVRRARSVPAPQDPEQEKVGGEEPERVIPPHHTPVRLITESEARLREDWSPQSGKVDYDAVIRGYKEKATTPKKAIRAMCVECMGGMIAEVSRCGSLDCSLHPFRMGENPFHALSKHNTEAAKRVARKGEE